MTDFKTIQLPAVRFVAVPVEMWNAKTNKIINGYACMRKEGAKSTEVAKFSNWTAANNLADYLQRERDVEDVMGFDIR